MSGSLHVLWTIVSADPPRPLLHCGRCGRERGFVSSGKFRLNANGKKLDAWLVYRCCVCGDSFNRAIFERRSSAGIDPGLIEALHRNDAGLARRIAFDLSGGWANGFETSATAIARRVLPPEPDGVAHRLVIRVAGAAPGGMRADRLIAHGLGLPRREVEMLARAGCLVIAGSGGRALSRPLRDGAVVEIDLSGRADAAEIVQRAAGDAD